MTSSSAIPIEPRSPQPPPGPGWGMLGRIPELRRDPLQAFRRLAADYGGLLRLNVPRLSFYLISEPDYVKHVLQDNQRNYIKGSSVEPARILVGQGLATSDGDLWLGQRRLMQPAFHRRRLAALAGMMTDTAAERLERWDDLKSQGVAFDLMAEMMSLTLEVIVRTMFSHDVDEEGPVLSESFAQALRYIDDRSFGGLAAPLWLPTRGNRRFKAALERLDAIVNGVVSARRKSSGKYEDLLGMLLAAQDPGSGAPMAARQLRDEIVTIFFAGHETTALTLTWAWTQLFHHPEWKARLQDEIKREVGDRRPTVDDLPGLKQTRMVIDETLRLFPPAWIFARSTVDEDVIGGYRLPAGANILLSPYITHRDPALWPDPDRFRPERFDPDSPSLRKPLAYYPFGAGPRLCIGRDFALMEATLLLAMMIQAFDLDPLNLDSIRPLPLVTLRPNGPLWVRAV